MTDKKKLHQILSSLWKNDDSVGKAYYNQALQDVQTAIDLQEEPVSKLWHEVSEETPTQGSNILMVRKEEKDTNYPPIAGCFHGTNSRLDGRSWGYYNGFCYNEIEPPVKWAYIDDILNFSNVQRTVKNWKEPVSEDLEELINTLSKRYPEVSFAKLSRIAVHVAKWQKERTIKRAVDWLSRNINCDDWLLEFRKVMED